MKKKLGFSILLPQKTKPLLNWIKETTFGISIPKELAETILIL
jgi:hypothetical protein